MKTVGQRELERERRDEEMRKLTTLTQPSFPPHRPRGLPLASGQRRMGAYTPLRAEEKT